MQAILVDRDIFGGVDGNYAWRSQGFVKVDVFDARMWTPGKQDFHVQHALHRQVARVRRFACHFAEGIDTGQGLTNNFCRHKISVCIF